MIASQVQFDLLKKRLNRHLGRKLETAVKVTLDSILESGNETSFKYKLEGKLKQSQRLIVLSMRTTYVDLFVTEREASQYVTAFFNSYTAVTVHNYLVKKKYYKTPHDGLVYIPEGEITDYSPNGGVYGFKVKGRHFFWNNSEELYFDLYQRVYNPYGDIDISASTPRYVKEAYKHLLKVRIKEPRAFIAFYNREEGYKEALVEYWPNPTEIHVFGNYPNDGFTTDNFPEVGLVEGMTPFLGSGKSFMYSLEDGDNWSAAFHATMFVSDAFLANSIRKGVMKGGLKAMGKNYRNWSDYRQFYKRSGFAKEGEELHHWFSPLNGNRTGQTGLKWRLKNQMWNMKRFSSRSTHFRWGHGWGFPSKGLKKIPYWKFTYPIMASPTWFKAGVVSGGLRGVENYKRH